MHEGHPSSIGLLTLVLLVLEFLAAMWIKGIIFTAVLFGLMSAAFAVASLVLYLLSSTDLRSGASRRLGPVQYLLLIALVSSASIALLAGIFSLPLLFNGGFRKARPEWRIPAMLGSIPTSQKASIQSDPRLYRDRAVQLPFG
jgi:hypothetical protein